MVVAGVDVGAGTAKAVVLEDNKILGFSVIPTGGDVSRAAAKVTEETLVKARVSKTDLKRVVATGYGRNAVTLADRVITEIICHAKGAYFLIPQAKVIIDIGCQDNKVIRIDEKGNVADFVMNDKCAAGTGRFLEVMAQALGLQIEEIGPVSLKASSPCQISSTCTVFAESEVVSLRAEGKSRGDLIAGIHNALALRLVLLGSRLGFEREIVFTGGVAKNIGIKTALEQKIGFDILVPKDPQIIGALGAALLARDEEDI